MNIFCSKKHLMFYLKYDTYNMKKNVKWFRNSQFFQEQNLFSGLLSMTWTCNKILNIYDR